MERLKRSHTVRSGVKTMIAFLVIFVASVGNPGFRANAESNAHVPLVDELWFEMLEAFRLPGAFRAQVTTTFMTGSEVTWRGGVLEALLPSGPFRIVYDKPEQLAGIEVSQYGGITKVLNANSMLTGNDGLASLVSFALEFLLFIPDVGVNDLHLEGYEDIDDRVTAVVEATSETGVYRFWLDKEFYLPLRVELGGEATHSGEITAENGNLKVYRLVQTDDHISLALRPQDEFLVPVRLELSIDDLHIIERYAHIEVNPELGRTRLVQRELEPLVQAIDIAQAALESGDYVTAYHGFREAVRLDPYRAFAHMQLGYVAMQLNDIVMAQSALEQALMLTPHDPLANNNLAFLLIDLDLDVDLGVSLAEKAVSSSPDHPAFEDTLGWGYYRQGKLTRALDVLTHAASLAEELEPDHQAEILSHLLTVQRALGLCEEAGVTTDILKTIAGEAIFEGPTSVCY